MEASGVYEDIVHFDFEQEVLKLQAQNDQLLNYINNLEVDVEKLCNEITKMKAVQDSLSKNISSLFNTARTELDRKDKMIADLQGQLDDLLFNRIKFNSGMKKRPRETEYNDEQVKKIKIEKENGSQIKVEQNNIKPYSSSEDFKAHSSSKYKSERTYHNRRDRSRSKSIGKNYSRSKRASRSSSRERYKQQERYRKSVGQTDKTFNGKNRNRYSSRDRKSESNRNTKSDSECNRDKRSSRDKETCNRVKTKSITLATYRERRHSNDSETSGDKSEKSIQSNNRSSFRHALSQQSKDVDHDLTQSAKKDTNNVEKIASSHADIKPSEDILNNLLEKYKAEAEENLKKAKDSCENSKNVKKTVAEVKTEEQCSTSKLVANNNLENVTLISNEISEPDSSQKCDIKIENEVLKENNITATDLKIEGDIDVEKNETENLNCSNNNSVSETIQVPAILNDSKSLNVSDNSQINDSPAVLNKSSIRRRRRVVVSFVN